MRGVALRLFPKILIMELCLKINQIKLLANFAHIGSCLKHSFDQLMLKVSFENFFN